MTLQEWSGIDSPFETDSECILLLPVLVERNFDYCLLSLGQDREYAEFSIYGEEVEIITFKPTISQAICSAVLEVIRKESGV